MSDMLIDLGKNKIIRQVIKKMALPVPLPQELKRNSNPWEKIPLKDFNILYGQIRKSPLTEIIADTLSSAGANTHIFEQDNIIEIFQEQSTPWGRLPKLINEDNNNENFLYNGLVFDCTDIYNPDELYKVYNFFHKALRKLLPNGKVILIASHEDDIESSKITASLYAIEGFAKSMAKEIGAKGSSINIFYVEKNIGHGINHFLRFFLSNRSAYITGQPIYLTNTVNINGSIPNVRPLDCKNAIVTGAARGIGKAIAKVLAREGAKVICLDRPEESDQLSIVSNEIKGKMLLCDISSDNAGSTITEFIKNECKTIDVIIHNAGITRDKMLVNMKPEIWNQTININLNSVINLTEKLLPLINNDGRIVCLASISGIAGNIGQTNYAASKAGIIGYVKSLSKNLAEKGIAVNAIAPGFIETQMTERIPFATREIARRFCSLSQGGKPEDVAELAAFLSSKGAGFMTGKVLRICGGNFLGA